jgi:cytochrome P450
VRIAPEQISSIHASVWKDAYGHRQGHRQFQKDLKTRTKPVNGIDSLFTADDVAHGRQRRLFAHALSEKALRAQEPLIRHYVDLLVEGLDKQVKSSNHGVVDMVKWYNYTTFDIMGDLSFGESFHCLEESAYHSWVSRHMKPLLAQFS